MGRQNDDDDECSWSCLLGKLHRVRDHDSLFLRPSPMNHAMVVQTECFLQNRSRPNFDFLDFRKGGGDEVRLWFGHHGSMPGAHVARFSWNRRGN
mmetsp:Transcript_3236/g.4564  ORF Transcript_3236/g.4564 Transcript_3236/m.4564 type:complete len:95 (+) Transcript_3236:1201-1485(+)